MRELYALIVGEAGVEPRYFFEKMTADEAADFLEGYRRRGRESWEIARRGWWNIACLLGSIKDGAEIEELFPFPWDTPRKKKRMSKKELVKMRQHAKDTETLINRIYGKEQ